jgi:two-component system, NarL family, response regulator DegU
MAKIKIILVDDHEIFISGLKYKLQPYTDFIDVIADAACYEELMAHLQKGLIPDVLVLDCHMPVMDGIAIAAHLRDNEKYNKIKILILSAFKSAILNSPDYDLIIEAIDAGVEGYILKDASIEDIVAAIENVHTGKTFVLGETIDTRQLNFVLVEDRKRVQFFLKKSNKFGLTPREVEVLQALAEGCSAKETAVKLNISEEGITNHKDNIKFKLKSKHNIDLKNVVEMVVWAIKNKVIEV